MDIALRRTAALELLAKTGICRSNYEPPLLRFLWRMGVDVPPPHFASFWKIAASSGVCFGMAWGLGWWFWAKITPDTPALVFWPACAGGLAYGLTGAAYYAYGRRKYKLPSWDSLLCEDSFV